MRTLRIIGITDKKFTAGTVYSICDLRSDDAPIQSIYHNFMADRWNCAQLSIVKGTDNIVHVGINYASDLPSGSEIDVLITYMSSYNPIQS